MLEHEGTVTVYLNGQVIGKLVKERHGLFWLPDEDLTRLVDTPPISESTWGEQTVEETLRTIEKAIERKKK